MFLITPFRTVSEGVFSETGLPVSVILGNPEDYKARKGPGCREPRRKGKLGLVLEGGIVSCPAYSTVTMTPNDKAVKR